MVPNTTCPRPEIGSPAGHLWQIVLFDHVAHTSALMTPPVPTPGAAKSWDFGHQMAAQKQHVPEVRQPIRPRQQP